MNDTDDRDDDYPYEIKVKVGDEDEAIEFLSATRMYLTICDILEYIHEKIKHRTNVEDCSICDIEEDILRILKDRKISNLFE